MVSVALYIAELHTHQAFLIDFKSEFTTHGKPSCNSLIIFNVSNSSSVVFTEYRLSSRNFDQVQNKIKTESTFFEIEFKFELKDFRSSSSSSCSAKKASSSYQLTDGVSISNV